MVTLGPSRLAHGLYRGVLAVGLLFAAVLKFEGLLHVDPNIDAAVHWIRPLRVPWVSGGVALMEALLAIGMLSRQWRRLAPITFMLSGGFLVFLSILVLAGMPTTACG